MPTSPTAATTPPTPSAARTGRLPNGELRRQVVVHLDSAPTESLTAGEDRKSVV